MELKDLQTRLENLRSEMGRTKDKQQRLMIGGEIRYINARIKRLKEGRTQLGVCS